MYAKKSGMTKTQCLNLMKKETWMYGEEAIGFGFANVLLETNEEKSPVQLINKNTLKINGIEHDVSELNIPDEFIQHKSINLGGKKMSDESLKTKLINAITSIFKNDAEGEEEKNEALIDEEENKESTTEVQVEELKEEFKVTKVTEGPGEAKEAEVVDNQEVINSIIEAERKRIQEIEKIANTIDTDLVQEAKFTNVCDAKELALRAIQRDVENNKKALKNLKDDSEASKVNEVESVQSSEIVDEEKLLESQIEKDVKSLFLKVNKMKEAK